VDGAAAEKKAPEPEPTFQLLTNPARVIPAQEKFIKFLEESRYEPVKAAPSGFVLLRDLKPTEAEELVLTDALSTAAANNAPAPSASEQGSAMAVDEEPQPPPAFEYTS
jgi:26S proteasome regulatory subunit N2